MIYPNETKNSVIFASLAMVAIIGISLVWLNVSVYGQTQDNKTLYNKDLNPRQVEYPAILGFNDLHIEAINHINPNMTSDHNSDVVKRIVHHHCKVYDDMTNECEESHHRNPVYWERNDYATVFDSLQSTRHYEDLQARRKREDCDLARYYRVAVR